MQGKRPIRFCSQRCYHAWRKKNNITGGQYKKGATPWNKNKKGIHLSPKTEFKKGRISETKAPVGTVRIRSCKGGHKRAFIKVADPNIWELRCHSIWKENFGEIPKGALIHHIDKNPMNDSISNLALVSRSCHMNKHRADLLEGRSQKKNRARNKAT